MKIVIFILMILLPPTYSRSATLDPIRPDESSSLNAAFDANVITAATLSISLSSPQLSGTSITFTGGGIGGSGFYEYRFWLKVGSTWTMVRPYSTANTWTWIPASVGNYGIQVDVRSAGSPTTTYEAAKVISYTITSDILNLTATPPNSTTAGTNISFIAADVGIENIQYRFWLKNSGVWSVVQNFSSSSSWTWITNGLPKGNYGIQVDYKVAGTFKVLGSKVMAYRLYPPATGATLNVSIPSPQIAGTSITFTGGGVDGSGVYEYRFWLKSGSTWSMVRPYSTANIWTWAPTTVPGNYGIQVDVRNVGATTTTYEAAKVIAYTIKPNLSKKGIFEDHGVAMTSISTYAGLFIDIPDIGKVYFGVTRSGQFARLFRYNVAQGMVDLIVNIPEAKGAWGITYFDKCLYIGTYSGANIYKYNVTENKLDKILSLTDATYVWDMKVSNGSLYIGTYPNAIIYKYDIINGNISKYQDITTNTYVRSIEEHNGKIYAGIGPKAQLIEYDMANNVIKDILPVEYMNESFVYDLKIINNKLFIGLSPSYDILEYDLATGEIINLMENANINTDVVTPTFSANYLHFQLIEVLFEYDIAINTLKRILPYRPDSPAQVGAYVDPLGKVIGVLPEGVYREYSFTGQVLKSVDFLTAGLLGLPDYPMSIAAYNNKVYLAGKRLRSFDVISKTDAYSIVLGEVKSMCLLDESLLTANYASAKVWFFPNNIVQNLAYHDLMNEKYNILTIGQSQIRPRKIVADSATMSLLVGTEPKYGQYGGALSYYNLTSGQSYTERNIIYNQTVFDVIYDYDNTNYAYIGTSAYGGTPEPIQENAHIVKWDIDKRRIVFDKIPEFNNKYQ